MLERTTNTTLFPYTTLFRSGSARFCPRFEVIRNRRGNKVYVGWYRSKGLNGVEGQDNIIAELNEEGEIQLCEDRKSTRLNSSHTVISYAVFCLKKKKIIRAQ